MLLPARPNKEMRKVRIGERELTLTMFPVRVEPFAFGVGYAEAPSSSDDAKRELVASGVRSLAANLGGATTNERAAPLEGHPCRQFEASGNAEGRAMVLAARVCATNRRFYQLVAIAPKDRAAELDTALFLGSLKLLK